MAFTMMFQGKTVERAFYNVDWAVGYGAPSHKIDTMLVQALMHIFFYEQGGMHFPTSNGGRIQMSPPVGQSSIAIDGILGPATQAHIDTFQDNLRRTGWPMQVDHRVDPTRETPVATIQKERYSIFLLNRSCNNNDVVDGTRFFMDLRWREDMPIALRSALRTTKKLAAQYAGGGGAQSSPAMKMAGGGGHPAAVKQV